MKKPLSIIALSAFSSLFAMIELKDTRVQLPSQQIIQTRMSQLKLDNICQYTGIYKALANQALFTNSIVLTVNTKMNTLKVNSPNYALNNLIVDALKLDIIETLLQDHPKAIAYLRQCGSLKEVPPFIFSYH